MNGLTLAELVLGLALSHGTPGRSPYSFELVPECGTAADAATCDLAPVCAEPAPACRPPRYSAARGGWVKMETRAAAVRRFATIARTLADTATRLMACGDGADCEPLAWSGTTRTLALATLTVVLHESGLREDVQFGHPPLGRGPAGESCLMQIALDQAPLGAAWLGPDRREAINRSRVQRERFAQSLLGDTPRALGRCFEVGMRLLARARTSCGRAGVPWDFGMFSLYGGGRSCNVPAIGASRGKTFQRLVAARPEPSEELRELLR